MFLIREFDWCKKYDLDKVEVYLSDDCATIHNSYKIKKISHMLDVIKWIRQYNKSVTKQNIIVMLAEWRVHNLLYWLNIERDRTQHCDIDINNWLIKTLYVIASFFYFGQ
jgi:hypothetical protein